MSNTMTIPSITAADIISAFGTFLALHEPSSRGLELLVGTPAHAAGRPLGTRGQPGTAVTGIVEIPVRGYLLKDESIFTDLGLATSTLSIGHAVAKAADDPAVSAIVMRIDSPGGSVGGMSEAAAMIRSARDRKPVYAHVEALCASGAYSLAAQATSISAVENALVGSIGTYSVVTDLSAMAEKLGIKVHVVRAGALKGAGTPGTEITAEQLDKFQRTVNALNETFIGAVAAGRRMTLAQVEAVGDGDVHIALESVRLGLIDSVVSTYSDSLSAIRKSLPAPAAPAQQQAAEPTIREILYRGLWDQLYKTEAGEKGNRIYANALANVARNAATLDVPKWRAEAMLAAEFPNHAAAFRTNERTVMSTTVDNRPSLSAWAAQYDQLVAAEIGKGTSKRDANVRISRSHPHLHAAWLQHHNPMGAVTLLDQAGKVVSLDHFRE